MKKSKSKQKQPQSRRIAMVTQAALPGGCTIFTLRLSLETSTGLFSDEYVEGTVIEMVRNALSGAGLEEIRGW